MVLDWPKLNSDPLANESGSQNIPCGLSAMDGIKDPVGLIVLGGLYTRYSPHEALAILTLNRMEVLHSHSLLHRSPSILNGTFVSYPVL